jgi:hypothetical protein
MAVESGEEHTAAHWTGDDGVPVLLWVLTHLHARGCRIAEEALILLKAGYGLGAYSRWRALHETVVVGAFIRQQGGESATRYLDHIDVDRWLGLRAASQSGRITPEEQNALGAMQPRIDQLVASYGKGFLGDYGWAGDPSPGDRGFRAIEKATDFGHLRFDYRQASAAIHAGAAQILNPPDAECTGSTLLVGPSLVAIATPAHAVALSLVVASATLITATETSAGAFVLHAMSDIASRVGDVLVAAETEVEERAEEEFAAEQEAAHGESS